MKLTPAKNEKARARWNRHRDFSLKVSPTIADLVEPHRILPERVAEAPQPEPRVVGGSRQMILTALPILYILEIYKQRPW